MEPTSITIYILKVDNILHSPAPYYATHALARRAAERLARLLEQDLQEEYGDAFRESWSESTIDVCRDVDQYPQCYARVHIETANLVVDYQNTLDA